MHRLVVLGLLASVIGCEAGGPVLSDRLVIDFPLHRGAMLRISDGLAAVKDLGVTGLRVDQRSEVFFLIRDTSVTLKQAQRRAPARLDSVLAVLAVLAPDHVIHAGLKEDGALICTTWSAGVLAGGGYAHAGTGGAAALRSRPGIDYLKAIPGDSTWFIWGT
jgi:hypothetical protein